MPGPGLLHLPIPSPPTITYTILYHGVGQVVLRVAVVAFIRVALISVLYHGELYCVLVGSATESRR